MGDNKNLIDGRDDVAVNRSQQYEVDYFVDYYLRTRNLQKTAENRAIVERAVHEFEPRRKVFRDELNAAFDAKWSLKKVL